MSKPKEYPFYRSFLVSGSIRGGRNDSSRPFYRLNDAWTKIKAEGNLLYGNQTGTAYLYRGVKAIGIKHKLEKYGIEILKLSSKHEANLDGIIIELSLEKIY